MASRKHGGALNAALLCIAAMAVVSVLLSLPHAAVASISCGEVSAKLAPCLPYLTVGGKIPMGCCNGISSLKSAAKSTPDRQATCKCLKSLAKSVPGINLGTAEKLPGLCHVKVPYPISLKTDCSKVK